MGAPAAGFFLAYLLSISFVDEVSLNASALQKAVDYDYNMDFAGMVPGITYNGSIGVSWAVPDSALQGLDGKSITVKVTATAQNDSSAFFPDSSGQRSNTAETTLVCRVSNGSCAEGSILHSAIAVFASAQGSEPIASKISLKSEIYEALPETAPDGPETGIFGALNAFGQGLSANLSALQTQNGDAASAEQGVPTAGSEARGSLLGALEPTEGGDSFSFLRENPVISLAALCLVVLITGVFLLNSKD